MLTGFIRTMGAGPSVDTQRKALEAAQKDDPKALMNIFVDDREAAIEGLAPGDMLVVAEPGCLGTTSVDVLDAMAAVGRRGAQIMDLSTGARLSWHADAQIVLEFAKSADTSNREAIARKMREARAAASGRAVFEWDDAREAQLRALVDTGELSREQIAATLGCSRATVQRKLREFVAASGKHTGKC